MAVSAAVVRMERVAARQTIEEAHRVLGLNYSELARALGVDRRTLHRYRKQLTAPSARVRARMDRVREIGHLLNELFTDQEAKLAWLYGPVPMLRGRRPIDLIRQGELDPVLSALAGMYSGAQA